MNRYASAGNGRPFPMIRGGQPHMIRGEQLQMIYDGQPRALRGRRPQKVRGRGLRAPRGHRGPLGIHALAMIALTAFGILLAPASTSAQERVIIREVPAAPRAPGAPATLRSPGAVAIPPGALTSGMAVTISNRGWLGIGVEINETQGSVTIVISNVAPDSPADSAGIEIGDALELIDGEAATRATFNELAQNLEVGDRVALTVMRDGRSRVFTLVAAARPAMITLWRPSGEAFEAMEIRIDSVRNQVFRGMDSARVAFREGDGSRTIFRLEVDSLRAADARIREIMGVLRADSLGAGRPLAFRVDTLRGALSATGDARQALGRAVVERERAQAALQEARARGVVSFSPSLVGRHAVAGAQMIELNAGLAEYLGVGEEGVFVTEVVDGSPAHEAGLRAGDVIVRMNGRPVGSLTDVRAELNVSARSSSPTQVDVARRSERLQFTIPR